MLFLWKDSYCFMILVYLNTCTKKYLFPFLTRPQKREEWQLLEFLRLILMYVKNDFLKFIFFYVFIIIYYLFYCYLLTLIPENYLAQLYEIYYYFSFTRNS